MTSAGQIVGTSHFLAPERALGKPAEPPSDVYALGCVLYQVLTGHPPFLADQPASIMFQHVERAPIPPSELRPDVAGHIEALVLWMLAKDPARRPTAAQVAQGIKPPVVLAGKWDTTSVFRYAGRRPGRCLPGQLRRSLCWRGCPRDRLVDKGCGRAGDERPVAGRAVHAVAGDCSTPRPPVVVHTTMSRPSAASPHTSPRSTAPTRRGNPPTGQNKPKKPKP